MSCIKLSLLLLVLATFSGTFAIDSIRCYTCISTNNDLTCLNDPTAVITGSPITDCMGATCCTVYRQEYAEQPGIVSFYRGCQPNCKKDGFYESEDSHFKTTWTYCSDPLCNTGKGDEDIGGGGGGGDGDDGVIDGIHGKDGATSMTASIFTLLLSFFLTFYLVKH